jgi:hypothetical protein
LCNTLNINHLRHQDLINRIFDFKLFLDLAIGRSLNNLRQEDANRRSRFHGSRAICKGGPHTCHQFGRHRTSSSPRGVGAPLRPSIPCGRHRAPNRLQQAPPFGWRTFASVRANSVVVPALGRNALGQNFLVAEFGLGALGSPAPPHLRRFRPRGPDAIRVVGTRTRMCVGLSARACAAKTNLLKLRVARFSPDGILNESLQTFVVVATDGSTRSP